MPAEQWALIVVLGVSGRWAAAQDDAAAMPDLEFIEYLGTMVRADDGFIDPLDLERAAELDLQLTVVADDGSASDLEKQP